MLLRISRAKRQSRDDKRGGRRRGKGFGAFCVPIFASTLIRCTTRHEWQRGLSASHFHRNVFLLAYVPAYIHMYLVSLYIVYIYKKRLMYIYFFTFYIYIWYTYLWYTYIWYTYIYYIHIWYTYLFYTYLWYTYACMYVWCVYVCLYKHNDIHNCDYSYIYI